MQLAKAEQIRPTLTSSWLHSNWWPYALAILMAFTAKLPTLSNNIVFIDEPIYLAQAMRLNSFEAFVYAFQYRVETKFQLGLVPYMLAKIISLPNAILIVHLFGLVATGVTACLFVAISQRIFKERMSGLMAFFLWCLFINTSEFTAATILEYFQTPLILAAFWVFTSIFQHPVKAYRTLFWSGFCLGLATLVKPPALLVVPILILALILPSQPYTRILSAKFLKSALLIVSGWALPVVIFVVPYFFSSSALEALNFCLFQLTSTYATDFEPTLSILRRATSLLALFGPFNLAVIFTSVILFKPIKIRSPSQWSEAARYLLLTLLIGWALYAGYAVGQAKTHYLLPILAFLFFLPGYQIVTIFKKQKLAKRRLSVVFVIGICLLAQFGSLRFYTNLLLNNRNFYDSTQSNIDITTLANYVDANSQSQDSIWVYYNVSELYWKANRRPATTEPTGTWLVIVYSPFWFNKIATELTEDKPTLIVGIDSPRIGPPGAATLTELPVIGDMLNQRYICSRDTIPHTTICKLKV